MVKRNRKSTAGFSLLEFLAVMVLVAVLALIAVPIYDSYIKKARFQHVIVAVDSFKNGVAVCLQAEKDFDVTKCDQADTTKSTNGIPRALGLTGEYISSVTVTDGSITGIATSNGGLGGQTYKIDPTLKAFSGIITWKVDISSTCLDAGLCDNPS